MNNGQVTLDVC